MTLTEYGTIRQKNNDKQVKRSQPTDVRGSRFTENLCNPFILITELTVQIKQKHKCNKVRGVRCLKTEQNIKVRVYIRLQRHYPTPRTSSLQPLKAPLNAEV